MSCITVPKTWGGQAAPRVEAVSPVLPAATVQKRATKKARAAPQLVDTVREVVQAFEFEYAQVRAESVELKSVLDNRRTQLSDLRRHLEKESSENGTLEAVVQHRTSKNAKGDARLRELEREFNQILKDDRVIASRAAALECDLGVFTQEPRRVRELINPATSQLERAEAYLEKRESSLTEGLRESERLSAAVQEGRRKVEERQSLLRSGQERASNAVLLAQEAAAEAEALERDVVRLRAQVEKKDGESSKAGLDVSATKLQAEEIQQAIGEDRAMHTRALHNARNRLVELKRQVDSKEKANLELDERIRVVQLAVAAESEINDAKQGEIAALEASRKEAVSAETRQLSIRLEAVDAELVRVEEAVEQASDRMREANKEFSNLMAAMSAAFREYDQAVTTNRDLERDAAEAEGALSSLRENIKRDLSALRETRDSLASSNAEDKAAGEDDQRRAEETIGIVRDVQKGVEEWTSRVASETEMISACERRLEDGRARQRAEEEGRAEALQAAKEAEATAKGEVVAARSRLELRQSELIEIDRQMAEWIPPPVTLSESDLELVEKEAKSAVQSMRAGDDEAHATRIQSLRETLETIRDGGAARLQAEKDAAAARLAALQEKKLEISHSLENLRARSEAAQLMVATIALENKARKAAEQQTAAASAATGPTAPPPGAAQATTAQATRSRFFTPETRPNSRPSGGHQPGARGLGRTSLQTPGRGPTATGRSVSGFTTPEARPANRLSGVDPSTSARPVACVAVQTPGARGAVATGDGMHQRSKVTTFVEPAVRQGHSDRPAEPGRRSKKSSRSFSKEPPTRSQQASESTAEAAGSRKSASSGRKRSNTSNNKISPSSNGGTNKYKTREKLAARAPSKSTHRGNGRGHDRRSVDDPHRDHRSDASSKGATKSKSKSPRHRPRSPRPADKEYDLWTDNKLVGDSDFSFF